MPYKLFHTHNRSKDKGQLLMQNLFENGNTVRENRVEYLQILNSNIYIYIYIYIYLYYKFYMLKSLILKLFMDD